MRQENENLTKTRLELYANTTKYRQTGYQGQTKIDRQNTPRGFRAACLSVGIQERPYKGAGSPQNVDTLKEGKRRRNRGGRHTRQPLRSAVSKKRTLQNKAFVHFILRVDNREEHKRPTAKPNRRSDRQKATKPASPTVNRDRAKRSPPTRAGIQQAIS